MPRALGLEWVHAGAHVHGHSVGVHPALHVAKQLVLVRRVVRRAGGCRSGPRRRGARASARSRRACRGLRQGHRPLRLGSKGCARRPGLLAGGPRAGRGAAHAGLRAGARPSPRAHRRRRARSARRARTGHVAGHGAGSAGPAGRLESPRGGKNLPSTRDSPRRRGRCCAPTGPTEAVQDPCKRHELCSILGARRPTSRTRRGQRGQLPASAGSGVVARFGSRAPGP
jgi:hypothetical protein